MSETGMPEPGISEPRPLQGLIIIYLCLVSDKVLHPSGTTQGKEPAAACLLSSNKQRENK